MSKKRNIATIAVALALVGTVSIGFTLAYFKDSQTAVNQITSGSIAAQLTEPNWDPNKGLNLEPGAVVPKDPTVQCTTGEVYLQIEIQLQDPANNSAVITDPNRLDLINPMMMWQAGYDPTQTPVIVPASMDRATVTAPDFLHYNPQFYLDTTKSTPGDYFYYYIGDNGNGTDMQGDTADSPVLASLTAPEAVTLFSDLVYPTDYLNGDAATVGNFDIAVYPVEIQTQNLSGDPTAANFVGPQFGQHTTS